MLLHIDNAKAFLAEKTILNTQAVELSGSEQTNNATNVVNVADAFGNMIELTYNNKGYLEKLIEFDVADNIYFKTVFNWKNEQLISEDHFSDDIYQYTNTESLVY